SSDTPLSTSQITEKAAEMAKDEELDVDPETINAKRVGWILTRLRLEKVGREEGKKGRQRLIKMGDVERWRTAYSLFEPKSEGGQKQNGDNGENGGMAEDSAEEFWGDAGEVEGEWVG